MIQEHLGDGVYATLNRDFEGQVILTTDHHEEEQATNIVFLDAGIILGLVIFLHEKGNFEFRGDPA